MNEPTRSKSVETTLLKRDGGRCVYRVRRQDGSEWTRKTWPISPGEAFRLLLGIAQVQRQLRGTRRLLRIGLRTPGPEGSYRVLREGTDLQTELVMPFVEGESLRTYLCSGRGTPTERLSIAEQIGTMIATIAAHRLRNRDMKPDNLVIASGSDTQREPVVWLIDTVGVKRSLSVGKSVYQMLLRVGSIFYWLDEPLPSTMVFRLVRQACRQLSRRQARSVLVRLRMHVELIRELGIEDDDESGRVLKARAGRPWFLRREASQVRSDIHAATVATGKSPLESQRKRSA